jgi:hypothetical protein
LNLGKFNYPGFYPCVYNSSNCLGTTQLVQYSDENIEDLSALFDSLIFTCGSLEDDQKWQTPIKKIKKNLPHVVLEQKPEGQELRFQPKVMHP